MRRLAAGALLILVGCGSPARDAYEQGRETTFYQAQLRTPPAPAPEPNPPARAEDSLARVAAAWQGVSAQPAKLVRLIDLETPAAVAVMRDARASKLEDVLAAPTADKVLPAVYARNPKIAAALGEWRATLSRFGQAAAYDDLLRRYNAWTKRTMSRVGPPGGREPAAGSIPFPGMRGRLGSLVTRDARLARDRYVSSVNAVLTDARKLLHKLAYLDGAIVLTENHRKAVDAQASVARTRYQGGKAPYVDVLKAATELAELEDRLLTFRESRKAAAVALLTLLRRDTAAKVGPVRPAPSAPEVAHRGAALEQAVLAGSLELSMSREMLGRMRDMLGMAADQSYFKTLQRHYFFDFRSAPRAGPGRKAAGADEQPRRMPRMDATSGFVQTWVAELRQRITAHESTLEALRQQTKRRTEALFFKHDEARRRTALYDKEVLPKARQTLKAMETAYQGGKAQFISMVDALRRLLKAELSRIGAHRSTLDWLADLEALANAPLVRTR